MIQELVKDLVEKEYQLDISKNIRKADYVEARAMYYKLLRSYTNMSLDMIGKSVGKDHAVAINGINRLDGWLTYDQRVINLYQYFCDKVIYLIKKTKTVNIGERFKSNKSLEELYQFKYLELIQDYNELLVRFNFIKRELAPFRPQILDAEDFNVENKTLSYAHKEKA